MNIKINSDLQVAGCRFIKKQLAVLTRHLESVKTAGDIEDVHQARVACRRLRSAFNFFGDYFEEQVLQTWTQCIKKLMKTLGTARELDVQIEFLNEFLTNIDSDHKKMRPGIQRMSVRWRHRRDAAQIRAVKAIVKIQKKHLLTDIYLDVEGILFERQNSKSIVMPVAIFDRIYQQLQGRVADFMRRKVCLEDREDHTGHHGLRISVKRLRYEMEISDLFLGGRLQNNIKKIKTLQTILGDLHDCVVWESDMCAFIEQEKQRTIDYYGHGRPFARLLPGLEFFRQERQNHHDTLFAEIGNYITRLDQENFWDTFLEQLRTEKATEPTVSEDTLEDENKNRQLASDGSESV